MGFSGMRTSGGGGTFAEEPVARTALLFFLIGAFFAVAAVFFAAGAFLTAGFFPVAGVFLDCAADFLDCAAGAFAFASGVFAPAAGVFRRVVFLAAGDPVLALVSLFS